MRTQRPNSLHLFGALLALAALLVGVFVTVAAAQNPGDPALLVTDYENYPDPTPQTGSPAICSADDILLDQDGTGFTLNGGDMHPTLAALGDIKSGDEITATVFVTADCVGSVLSLTLKNSEQDGFDPGTNQVNVGYESILAVAGLTTISFTLPPINDDDCFYQLDAVVGYPLAIVGPDGSFYNPLNRGGVGRDMLINARNGTLTACAVTTTTSTSTTQPPSSTTSTQPPTTTTQPPTTTTRPPSSTTLPPTTAQPPGSTIVTSGGGTPTSVTRIPATGRDATSPMPLVAILLSLGVLIACLGELQRRAAMRQAAVDVDG